MNNSVKKTRKTYLKLCSGTELAKEWNVAFPLIIDISGKAGILQSRVLIKCNKKGIINWETASYYTLKEVIGNPKYEFIES